MRRRGALVGVLMALVAGLLTGCGDDRPYNETDVMFLQMLSPHHREGLEIVRLAGDRTLRPEVRRLVDAIATTQREELTRMTRWLSTWGEPATAPPGAHAGHGGMPGTTEAEMKAVAATPDAAFERAFLQVLLAHQDDAIQIARLELKSGDHRDVRDFARRVEQSRTSQVRMMSGWLEPVSRGGPSPSG